MKSTTQTPETTEKEQSLIKAIAFSEYGDQIKDPVWVNCLHGWSGSASYGGVAASLQKKGLIFTDGETIQLTNEGAAIALALFPECGKEL